MVEPDQRRGFSLLKVAVHGIPDLPVQLLQAVGLRVDGRAHGAGPIGAVVGLLHDKKDLVHADGSLPVKKADVIEYDTKLLREETITRYGEWLSIEQALRRQRGSHAQALLLMLPSLGNWSCDHQLSGQGTGFTAALERG